MEDGWDLHALVRSCATSSTICKAAATAEETLQMVNDIGVIDPLIQSETSPKAAVTPISFDGGGAIHEEPYAFGDYISFSTDPGDCPHVDAKKRKNKNKKVVVLGAEELNINDGWAWRKYGQKPIKGSPNPRNYYRCSTTKDCLARKQIERNPEDTSKFIVSYYGNHLHPRPTHPNSVASTTRSTRFGASHATLPEQSLISSSSLPSASSFSPTKSRKEDEIRIHEV